MGPFVGDRIASGEDVEPGKTRGEFVWKGN